MSCTAVERADAGELPVADGKRGRAFPRTGTPGDAGSQSRALAARALGDVLGNRASLPDAFERHQRPLGLSDRDRAFARELAWGAARFAPRLDHLVRRHLARPPRSRDLDVHALLMVGAYQLGWLDVPTHAVVHATVGATKVLRKDWARGLANAVLRRLSEDPLVMVGDTASDDAGRPETDLPDEARYAHPAWLLERLRDAWPAHWERIVAGGNARPPFTLRCVDAASAVPALEAAGFEVRRGALAPTALYLDSAAPVDELPGFAEGALSVQDEAAQLAARLLDPAAGSRVLDACAAPGGKTLHLLQHAQDLELVAVELEARRAERIEENLERGDARAALVVADVVDVDSWWEGERFDAILLDAPCTATGILRRQPDVRLLRREGDVAKLAATQRALLEALWPLLEPGGTLLYCTCSVLPEEGSMIVQAFAEAHPDALVSDARELLSCLDDPDVDSVVPTPVGIQLLPTVADHDGFFYARLRRANG